MQVRHFLYTLKHKATDAFLILHLPLQVKAALKSISYHVSVTNI